MRQFLRAKIHGLQVTEASIYYEGSFGIDAEYMKKVGLLPYESIDVYNITNGQRIRTYAIELPPGSRRFESNGAAAHLIRKGDRVILAAYSWFSEAELQIFSGPKVMLIGPDNFPKKFHTPKVEFKSEIDNLQLPA